MNQFYKLFILTALMLIGSVNFSQARKVLLEGYMGTWCGYCPRGTVVLDSLASRNNDVICIKYHGQNMYNAPSSSQNGFNFASDDIMPMTPYGYPAATANRALPWDNMGYSDGRYLTEAVIDSVRHSPELTSLYINKADFDPATAELNVSTSAVVRAPLEGDFRLAYFFVADGIILRQTNYYNNASDQTSTIPGLDWYVGKGTSVEESVDGCVLLASDTRGIEGSLMTGKQNNVLQSHSYTFDITDIVKNENLLDLTGVRVVVALVCDNTVYDCESYELDVYELTKQPEPEQAITSISFSDGPFYVNVGDKFTPTYIAEPQGWEEYDSVILESSDNNVAVIDDYGNITALQPGFSIITARSRNNSDVRAQMECFVNEEIVKSYTFSANERIAYRGTRLDIPVYLNNTHPILGFQMDVRLPEGMTFASDDDAALAQPTYRASHMQMSTSRRNDGSARILCFSNAYDRIAEGTDQLVKIPVIIAEETPDMLNLEINGITISDMDSKVVDCEPISVSYETRDLLKGDLDGDGRTSVADVTATVALALNHDITDITPEAADLNNDGETDIIDIVMLVDRILNEPVALPRRAKSERVDAGENTNPMILSVTDSEFNYGDEMAFDVNIKSETSCIGAQFELQLPEGFNLRDDSDAPQGAAPDITHNFIVDSEFAPHHVVGASMLENGNYKVLVYSLSNASFKNMEGRLMSIAVRAEDNVSGTLTGSVSGVKLVGKDFSSIDGGDSEYSVIYHNNTGIAGTTAESMRITSAGGAMHITGLTSGQILSICSIDGRVLHCAPASAASMSISLPEGTYIVSHNNQTKKMML